MPEPKNIATVSDRELEILTQIYKKLRGANREIIIMSVNLLLASQEAGEMSSETEQELVCLK